MGCTSSTSSGKRGRTGAKLYYFDGYGRAEFIRMALWAGKVPYEDVRLSPEQFGKLKGEGFFPTGSIPIWVSEDGETLNQSTAIFRHVGTLAGLYGGSPEDIYWADWAIETVLDVKDEFLFMPFMKPTLTDEEIAAVVEKFSGAFNHFEKRLGSNGGKNFIGGDKLSIGDIRLFAMTQTIFNDALLCPDLGKKCREEVTKRPNLNAWNERLTKHFAEYLDKRPKPRPI